MKRSVELSRSDIQKLYACKRVLGKKLRDKVGLSIPFEVYFQDPLVAEQNPEFGFDDDCRVDWEPGLADGPTSARFAVVDYNADTRTLAPPAQWDEEKQKYVHDGKVLDRHQKDTLQFHQVNVWAILQRALYFFEEPNGLGRRIPWGFEGNRLRVVPHAGYGQNAYYDRQSKSLQFYYFDKENGQVVTSLSTDIVHHELGHAILDGVRPLLNESASIETAAFHEFVGDLTAILVSLRNNEFRKRLVQETDGNLQEADRLAGIAEEFGKEARDRPYLRTAINDLTMSDVAASQSPHEMSQVMTGAIFDILLSLSENYVETRGRSARQAFADTILRMQRIAVQPLDFLPPVDVTFRDYALAMLRADEVSNPKDPFEYRRFMAEAFMQRGILDEADWDQHAQGSYLYNRMRLSIFHGVDQIGASKANAYRFLDDNRDVLKLPSDRDLVVADLYSAEKFARQARRLPRQLVLEYVWREDVLLEGSRFGRREGKRTTLLCGGTLVFDEHENVLARTCKENTEERRKRFLDDIAERVRGGQIGVAEDGASAAE
jgi:hypothetical protein